MKRVRFFGSMMRYSAVAAAVLAIAGCGGGGGGGDGGAGIDVTQANEDALAHAAAVAVQGGLLLDWTDAATAGARDTALRVLRVPALRAQREVAKAVWGPEEEQCDVSGKRFVTWDDRDNNLELSVGDALTGQFDACEDFAGEFMTGTAALTITEASTAGGAATASFTNLAVSVPAVQRSVTYNGTGTLRVNETSPTSALIQLSVPESLKVQATSPSFEDTITLRSGYTVESVFDWAAGTSTTTAGGDIVSDSAGGLVKLKTLSAIVQDESASFPRAGVVQLLGRTGSLTLTALDINQVRIEADYDGNGTVDNSRDEDWSWLL